MKTAVQQLWPPLGDLRKTELNVLFFHGYPRDPEEWKSTWTQRSHPDVCWPEQWLPADLGFDVRLLFVSYGQSRVDDTVDDLFKALVIRDEWDLCKNHQPLVLVGHGFGTLVLDKLFLKATEEMFASPTEAGSFVRNVRGVTLYGDNIKSYKIENYFEGTLGDYKRVIVGAYSPSFHHGVFITHGSMLIHPAIYGKNLTRDVVRKDPCQWIKEDIWEVWDPEVRWKPECKQSRGYNLLLESCRMVYNFSAIFGHLLQKLDNISTAFNVSSYSGSMFENEFTYLRRNGSEGAKILILQRMLEQHMVAKKSDDSEQLENERLLKFTVAKFCESHKWHMIPTMRESDIRQTIECSLNDVVHENSPLSDDAVNRKMQSERKRESLIWRPFRNNDSIPIHFPSVMERRIMNVEQLQRLASSMQPGENLTQEDVQEQLRAHVAQVLDGGKLIVTANVLEGKINFLFGNAKSMAKIVGVGLDFAIVSMTDQHVIVVECITELEWTKLWGEVFLGKSKFENPIFMENVGNFPPDLENTHENVLSEVAMYFMIKKFLQSADVEDMYNQVVRATTMIEEVQSDVGQVHDPRAGILGLNLWDYFSRLQMTSDSASATKHTSGEGGMDVGGTDSRREGDKAEGGDGGEDGDNRKGRGAEGEETQQNNQWEFLVTVYTGYEPGVWNKDRIPEELKKSHITPILEFLFKKTEKQRTNTIESKIKVCCDMYRSSLDDITDCLKRYGWCQNHLHIALQCLGRDAATLCGSSLVGTQGLKDTYMEQTQGTSSQATLTMTGGFGGFASASASVTKPLASTLQSNQRIIERPCEVISGTGFQPECHSHGGESPVLSYDFKFRPNMLSTNEFPDESDQDKYNGMRCTVYPSCKDVWGLLSEDEACEYEFRVKRHVFELVCDEQSLNSKKRGRDKQKRLCNCNTMVQTYKVRLYINHKMSNIATLSKFGTDTLSKIYPENALMKLSGNLNVRGSGASSSTQ